MLPRWDEYGISAKIHAKPPSSTFLCTSTYIMRHFLLSPPVLSLFSLPPLYRRTPRIHRPPPHQRANFDVPTPRHNATFTGTGDAHMVYLRCRSNGPISSRGIKSALRVATQSRTESREKVFALAEARHVPAALLRHGRERKGDPDLRNSLVGGEAGGSFLLVADWST